MSYEVYVDVRHHPRHNDDDEQRLSNCGKYTWEWGEPWEPIVAGCLRELADRVNPEPVSEADERRVWVALNGEIQRVRREYASSPNTLEILLRELLAVADALGLGEEFLPGLRPDVLPVG